MDENTTTENVVIDVREAAELTTVANPRRTQL
ncbi:hypothetical protein CLV37_101434 [Kineococcus rhizosphaerae]|uniref:Uncharacterized protein n=1 Tax=Kineococcus rhizosphaerae TaxID=559628 RepID=A0A2T0RAK4_9ACTN|nr:hypothetical protein CLV37_101434 [Kineococcus rhizosphaerae]